MSTDRSLPITGQRPAERADAARNRALVLGAARELFACRGACDVSIDDIARAAGVGKGTVYRRFGDRAGLLEAVLDDRERALQAAVLSGPPPLGPGAPAAERLEAFLCALVDQLDEIAELRAEIEAGVHWLGNAPYRFRAMHVAMLLREADPTLDAPLLADALLAPLSAGAFRYHRDVEHHPVERLKAAMRTLTRGLVGATAADP